MSCLVGVGAGPKAIRSSFRSIPLGSSKGNKEERARERGGEGGREREKERGRRGGMEREREREGGGEREGGREGGKDIEKGAFYFALLLSGASNSP